MKIKALLVAVLLLLLSVPAFALDKGAPDSLIMLTSRPNINGNDSIMIVELYYWIDSNTTVIGISSGFNWDSLANDMTLDSVKFNPALAAVLTAVIMVNGNDYVTANAENHFMFFGINPLGMAFLPTSQSRQLLGYYYFTLDGWSGTDSVVLDTNIWYSGVNWKFEDPTNGTIEPVAVFGNSINRPLVVKDPSDVQDDNDLLPNTYSLMQNYPNPFNPKTTIQFDLAKSSDYTLTIYNVLGQKVDMFEEYGERGRQIIEWDASQYASGIYFYKLETKEFVDTKKMVLLK
ncbi:MAG: T9SS type A sorting domain-containing protein [candidate division Zixibacteria bacterium]|nr:T9SS type A sorting domain-containing protein [candidate division Zixibacteria bacterium]